MFGYKFVTGDKFPPYLPPVANFHFAAILAWAGRHGLMLAMTRTHAKAKAMKRIGCAAIVTVALSWIVFFAVEISLGGTALNGKVEGGRFYVGRHGQFTEVSESAYRWSVWVSYSQFALYAILLTIAFVLTYMRRAAKNL